MSNFFEKYNEIKKRDEQLRKSSVALDPMEEKKQHEKMNYLFKKNIAKTIFDYEYRKELIDDFKKLSLREKRLFIIKEFGIDPDDEPDPKPGELKEGLQPHDESLKDLRVPVCRKCGKPHNPFEPCFGA
ncbi:MAG: hypothetical protein ACTSVI_16140 [Promethearchaeota archaeon]